MSSVTLTSAQVRWRNGLDSGISSVAIWSHMVGITTRPEWGWGYPLDPDDLGRCIRLLRLFPAWRERIGEMGAYSEQWKRLAAAWTELEEVYESEAPEHARGEFPWVSRRPSSDQYWRAPLTYAEMRRVLEWKEPEE